MATLQGELGSRGMKISCWRHYRQLVLQSKSLKLRQYKLFQSDRLYHSTAGTMRYMYKYILLYLCEMGVKHNVCRDIKWLAPSKVTARDWLGCCGTLWLNGLNRMTYVVSCDFATEPYCLMYLRSFFRNAWWRSIPLPVITHSQAVCCRVQSLTW